MLPRWHRSAVELVELLQPDFVTLEEVPGFLVQK
jgi:site-specific DNA-cytosine methylase